MELLTVEQTLNLIFDRTDAVGVLWNFYIIVTLGVLGFMAKAASGARALRMSRLVAFGFLLFALSNLAGMYQFLEERGALIAMLKQLDYLPESYELIKGALFEWSYWIYVPFHLVMDLAILFVILWLGKRGATTPHDV